MNKTQTIAAVLMVAAIGWGVQQRGCNLPDVPTPPPDVVPVDPIEPDVPATDGSEWAELVDSAAEFVGKDADRPYAIRKIRYASNMADYLVDLAAYADDIPDAVFDLETELHAMAEPGADVTDELRAKYQAALRATAEKLRVE